MIIEPTLSLGYEPTAWHSEWPSIIQWSIVLGSIGWFGLLFLAFVKIIPSVSMYEVKEMVYHRKSEEDSPPMTLPAYALTGGGAAGLRPAASKPDPEGGGG
jgi:molybdopterin-containing oxidoreductase family membrane subunit